MTTMRVMGGRLLTEMPMEMLLPKERRAIRNHGQSLHRLHDRGGLKPQELLAIIKDIPIDDAPTGTNAEQELYLIVQEYRNGDA